MIQTKKYLSAIKSKLIILSVLVFLICKTEANAQKYILKFTDTSLSEALIRISGNLNIKVAFDAKKLGSVKLSRVITGNSADELITALLENTGFGYTYKYSRYLIVENGKTAAENFSGYQIIGSVSDDESGESLPFSIVILYNSNLQLYASAEGSFSIKNANSNPVHLFVSHIGYNQLDTIIYLDNLFSILDIRLKKQLHSLDIIEVKGKRTEVVDLRNDFDFATTINTSRLFDLPSVAESDIFRVLQIIPGISYNENSQGLSIRGSPSDQNLVLFDGQTLYNLTHYYGLVSVINPNIIKDMQVYKGGFDSRFGERVSGIVDITGKTGNQVKPVIYGDINFLSGNVTAEVPVGRRISLIGAYRHSISDLYSTGLSNKSLPQKNRLSLGDSATLFNSTRPRFNFYDYNAKLTFRPGNTEVFSLILSGGKDYMRNDYSGTTGSLNIDTHDRDSWNNYGFSAGWSKQWNESLYSNIQAGTSGYGNRSSSSSVIEKTGETNVDPKFLPDSVNNFNTYNHNSVNDLFFSMKNSYKTVQNNEVDFGLLLRQIRIEYYKDAERQFIYDNLDQRGLTVSAYIQDKIKLKNLFVKPGLRYTYFNKTGRIYTEPRFAAGYRVSDRLSARLSMGRYAQYINQVQTQQETGYNKNFWLISDDWYHPVVTSNHYIAGITAERGRFLLDAEIYYKTSSGIQENISVSAFLKNNDFIRYFPEEFQEPPLQPQEVASFYITGTGKSYGTDLMLRYKGKSYTGWLSASLGRSKYSFPAINSGSDIPAATDIPYTLSWTNMLTAGKWNFGSISTFSSGRPYIDYSRSNDVLPVTRLYKRLPNSFTNDLSVNYNFSAFGGRFKTGVSLINVFNSRNYLDVNTRKIDFESNSFSQITLVQDRSFSINMFLHFAF
ncbi:MAG TPA: TonB-dependent receptor plug domain-containing protein [Bacteroidales bacterium]|nr:TonB-dependent receptor plug domain-containing protein [Bacteroidales bacterium]